MSMNHPKTGPNFAPAYQTSGVPYVTSSAANEVPINTGVPIKLEIPFVTKFFQIENTDLNGKLRVGFSLHGVKPSSGQTINYFVVGTNSKSSVYDIRTKDLFFLGDDGTNPTSFRVSAGLTTIDRKEFPTLTGSINGTASFEGVG